MKYALFIVEYPNAYEVRDTTLLNFASNVREVGAHKQGVEMLNAGAYLCSLEHGLHGLSLLSSYAEDRKLPSRTLFFDQIPSWVSSK